MCSVPMRANGDAAPRGSAPRYASSSSSRPPSTRANVVSAYAVPTLWPRSEMRLRIGQKAFPRGLELLRRQALGVRAQRLEALAHRDGVVDLARGGLGV